MLSQRVDLFFPKYVKRYGVLASLLELAPWRPVMPSLVDLVPCAAEFQTSWSGN